MHLRLTSTGVTIIQNYLKTENPRWLISKRGTNARIQIENISIVAHVTVSNPYLLYLLVSTRAVIGQFSGLYSPVRSAKI